MARIDRRNFGLPHQWQAHPRRRSMVRSADEAIATLLSCLLLIGAGFAALCWWLLRRMLALSIGSLRSRRSLPSPRFLLAARERFFRHRRRRWCRSQALRDGGMH
jgi:hypothetical protein